MPEKDNQPTETDRDRDIRMSANVLGQLDDQQRHFLEVDLQANVEMRNQQEDLLRVASALSHQHAESLPAPSLELRNAIHAKLEGGACLPDKPTKTTSESTRWSRHRVVVALAVTACLLMLLAIPIGQGWRTRQATVASALVQEEIVSQEAHGRTVRTRVKDQLTKDERDSVVRGHSEIVLTEGQSKQFRLSTLDDEGNGVIDNFASINFTSSDARPTPPVAMVPTASQSAGGQPRFVDAAGQPGGYDGGLVLGSGISGLGMGDSAEMRNLSQSHRRGTTSRKDPKTDYGIATGTRARHDVVPVESLSIEISGRIMRESARVPTFESQVVAGSTTEGLYQIPAYGVAPPSTEDRTPFYALSGEEESESKLGRDPSRRRYRNRRWYYLSPQANHEQYEAIIENPFVSVRQQVLSTLSIDVDTASYANVRRFLTQNQLPPANAVRIEELINYFSYDYPAPEDDQPFATHLEVTECPWRPNHRLVRVGLQGKRVAREERPGCNLDFLLDVSG